ncbi:MAG: SOS response-associated peptidase [Planctomycetota bacterium]
MCGRFALSEIPKPLAEVFGLGDVPDIPPRYNIAPTQPVWSLLADPVRGTVLRELVWGLVPHWARDRAMGSKLINARAETASQKPAFRDAFRSRRCLIPADGFYEWDRAARRKQPYFIRLAEKGPMLLAGLWEEWTRGGENPLRTCAILTTEANDLVRSIHERMPVILSWEDCKRWVSPGVPPRELQGLLRPCPAQALTMFPVSAQVNNPKNDGPECIRPAEPSP